ncbi:hypothetical protein MBT84_23205 [Streptomyces sp. MBT84]|nr:hypothetical protein [Streptomyces sp. MBT84]
MCLSASSSLRGKCSPHLPRYPLSPWTSATSSKQRTTARARPSMLSAPDHSSVPALSCSPPCRSSSRRSQTSSPSRWKNQRKAVGSASNCTRASDAPAVSRVTAFSRSSGALPICEAVSPSFAAGASIVQSAQPCPVSVQVSRRPVLTVGHLWSPRHEVLVGPVRDSRCRRFRVPAAPSPPSVPPDVEIRGQSDRAGAGAVGHRTGTGSPGAQPLIERPFPAPRLNDMRPHRHGRRSLLRDGGQEAEGPGTAADRPSRTRGRPVTRLSEGEPA